MTGTIGRARAYGRAVFTFRLAVCTGALFLFAARATSQEASDDESAITAITQVIAPSTPLLRNDSLVYAMDIVFKQLAGKFWSYLDNPHRNVVIELYGLEITAPDAQFSRSSPVRKLTIKNQNSKMALSGKLSTISITIDQGWHFEVMQPDSNSIRLVLGKKLEIQEVREKIIDKKKHSFFSYIGAIFGAAVALSVATAAIITR
jgi:hypothetical protein